MPDADVPEQTPPPGAFMTAETLKATKSRPRKIVTVELPDVGTVCVRSLTGLELDKLDDSVRDERGKYIPENVRAKYVAMCACDPEGKPLFVFTPDVVADLGTLDGPSVLDPIYNAAVTLNKQRAVDQLNEKKD